MSQASFPGVTRIVGTVLCVVGEAGGGWRVSYETEGGRAELRATSVVLSTGDGNKYCDYQTGNDW